MYKTEKLLQMLTSPKVSVRYDACEILRGNQESSPRIIRALNRTTNDPDQAVAERARYALKATIHHQMAIKMGITIPDNHLVNHDLPSPEMSSPNNEMRVKKDTGIQLMLGFFGIFFGIISLISISNALSTQRLIDRSKTWPSTNGIVVSSYTKSIPSTEWDSGGYEPIITYRYNVSGSNYECNIKLGIEGSKAQATDILEAYSVGSQFKVHFNPESPWVCVSMYDKAATSSWIILSWGIFVISLILVFNAILSIVRN